MTMSEITSLFCYLFFIDFKKKYLNSQHVIFLMVSDNLWNRPIISFKRRMLLSCLQASWLYQRKPPSIPKSCQPWKIWRDSSLEGVIVFSVTLLCSLSLWWMVLQLVPWWMVPCSYLQEGCCQLQVRRACWPFPYFMLQMSLPRWRTKERRQPSYSLCLHWH